MNLTIIKKTSLIFSLVMCLAVGGFAQKNKIKGKKEPDKSDSTKTTVTPPPLPGKSALKNSGIPRDSTKLGLPDSLREKMIQMANASADSVEGAPKDSLVKPRKRFYTRVKSNDLTTAEARAEGLVMRIEIAEQRLADFREAAQGGEEIAFSKEELDAFAASIASAREKLLRADTALLAVRNKLATEGRLTDQPGTGSSAEGTPEMDLDIDIDEEDIDEPDLPDAGKIQGGKGGIKTLPVTPPAESGKGKKKSKLKQEEDIDNG